MPSFDLTLIAVTQTLDQAALLARPLFFPELSAIGTNRQRLSAELTAGARKILKDLSPLDLYRRRPAGTAQVVEYAATLPPPRADSRWQKPVTVTFHAVIWEHAGAGWLACVPALGVEIFAPDREELDRRVPAHILFALKRRQETSSLQPLVHYGRRRRVTARPVRFSARIATPREVERAEGKRVRRSVLKECATTLFGVKVEGDTLYQQRTVGRLSTHLAHRLASFSAEAPCAEFGSDVSTRCHSKATGLSRAPLPSEGALSGDYAPRGHLFDCRAATRDSGGISQVSASGAVRSIADRISHQNGRFRNLKANDCYFYDTAIQSCDGAWEGGYSHW